MIDIHCHLLPGIDDGPGSMDESLALARASVADGVTAIIVTPHIHQGRWDNDRAGISALLCEFQLALQQAGIPLNTTMAAEVRLDAALIPLLERQELPYLGRWQNQQVLLLELPHGHIPAGTEKLIEWMLKRNVLPMIAHPERNKAIIRTPQRIAPLIELGCLFQVTAGALTGQFGPQVQAVASDLVSDGVATLLASDAHNLLQRPPNLAAGYAAAVEMVGVAQARKLVHDNPLQLFNTNHWSPQSG